MSSQQRFGFISYKLDPKAGVALFWQKILDVIQNQLSYQVWILTSVFIAIHV
jgi:hypothetical protein